MYEVILYLGAQVVATALFRSITQVAKFVDTVDFNLINVEIISPKLVSIDAQELWRIWNA